jgi:chromosome segregation ATPase
MECFNQILFDFNIQFNELQSQEEGLRREILKKHKEIEKLNFDIEECKKQRDNFIKELQNIAVKLSEYKTAVPKKCECDHSNCNKEGKLNDSNLDKSKNSIEEHFDEDDINPDDYNLLLNADNREYLIKKILQENKKYKSIVKVMKTEEAEFSNYLLQLEAELDNFGKFKNFCLTKMNTIDEGVIRCRERVDILADKVNNVEFQLEMTDDN